MSKDYRHYAAQCLALAQLAGDACARAHLVQLAERWREMAQKSEAEESASQDPPVKSASAGVGFQNNSGFLRSDS